MSDATCDICHKPIEPNAETAELGDQRFHADCLKAAAEKTLARALAEADAGKPQ
jgi:hypothetical protein